MVAPVVVLAVESLKVVVVVVMAAAAAIAAVVVGVGGEVPVNA